GRADREAVIVADGLGELFLVLAEARLKVDLDAAILEDLHGGGRQGVRDENARSGHGVSLDRRLPPSSSPAQCSAWGPGGRRRTFNCDFGATGCPACAGHDAEKAEAGPPPPGAAGPWGAQGPGRATR